MIKINFTKIAFLIVFFLAGNLYSQLPTAPINLNTEISYDGSDYVLLLTWQSDADFALTDFFNIYLATGNTENPGDFSLSATLTRDGDEATIYSYSHTFSSVDNYSVYISGQNISGEGPASAFMHFLAGPTIDFTTIPGETEKNGIVNIFYSYDVDAVASDAGSVTFSLQEPIPSGMSIDANTGSLTWTPIYIGWYPITVIARHTDYPIVEAAQSWHILVKRCSEPTIIKGYVEDQYAEAINNVNIILYSISPIDTTYYYYGTTDETGYFEIEVLEGNYKAHVSGDTIYSEWYENADTEEEARTINIACGDTNEIDFSVQSYLVRPVTGFVLEDSTSYPVYPGTVEFLALSDNKIVNVFSVQTANDGSFQINLSNQYDYKVLAYDNYTPQRFIPMYFNNNYDFLEANYFVISRSKTGNNLNFILKEYPISLNALNGTVRDEDGNGVKSMLILYKHREMKGVRTIESDDEGNFSFRNIETGKYIVRAIPFGSFQSGFYHKTDDVVPHWFDATLIEVDENTEFINHLMIVQPIGSDEGNYNIEGQVFAGENSINLKNEKIQLTFAIQGALVTLHNSNDYVIGSAYTDESGEFSFKNLKSGHYTIKADKIGYKYFVSDDVYINEIDSSKLVDIYLEAHPHTNPTISFKSVPTVEAYAGQLYSYDAEAVTNGTDSVKYELIEAPEGMTVNAATGLINWVPESSGTFTVTLEAFLQNSPNVNAQQAWSINVYTGENTAYLSVLVKQGVVFYPNSTLNLYSSDFSSTFTITTDTEGKALLAVPSGDYYLHLSGEYFEDCWYNNKANFADADMISLTAGDTLFIEASVTEKIARYLISGLVTSNASVPIQDASVHFILETGEIRTVLTDTDGKFTFEIGMDTAFRAFAVKDGEFAAQFYSILYDFAEAPLLKNFTSTNFNFQLEQLPQSTVNIEGTILDESALQIPGVVIAYKVLPTDAGDLRFNVDFVNSVIATDGNYKIAVPSSGDYFLRAYPADLNYYPAYYSEEVAPVYTWLKADIIQSSGGLIEDKFIRTEKVTATSGNGKISGNVDINFLIKSSSNYDQMAKSGFTVFAFDQDEKICKYTYTDSLSNYYLKNLGLSQWKIAAEKVGLSNESAERSLTLSQSVPVFVDIQLFYYVGSSVDEEAEKIISIYPNPANAVIIINFKEENILNSTISIFDNLGNERISFINYKMNASIDVSKLPSGNYYLRIKNGLKTYSIPFIKMK